MFMKLGGVRSASCMTTGQKVLSDYRRKVEEVSSSLNVTKVSGSRERLTSPFNMDNYERHSVTSYEDVLLSEIY
jgi:hypothetical protein